LNPRTRHEYEPHVRKFIKTLNGKALSKIMAEDIERYVLELPTYHCRSLGLAAVKHYLGHACVRLPARRIDIGRKPAPPPIQELTPDEWHRLRQVVSEADLEAQVAFGLLEETGHRRRAIVTLPRSAVKSTGSGLVVEFPPDGEKRAAVSVSPISERLYHKCMELAETHGGKYVLPIEGHEVRERWLNSLIKRLAKAAEVTTPLHPHSFRHFLALKARRAGKEPDAVINAMGWTDSQQYNNRYGRRGAYETANEFRDLVDPEGAKNPQPAPGPAQVLDLRRILRK